MGVAARLVGPRRRPRSALAAQQAERDHVLALALALEVERTTASRTNPLRSATRWDAGFSVAA